MIDTVCFAIFVVEIFLNCCRQYKEIDGKLVQSHKKIIKRYFYTGSIFIDLASTVVMILNQNRYSLFFRFLRIGNFTEILDVFTISRKGIVIKLLTGPTMKLGEINRIITTAK